MGHEIELFLSFLTHRYISADYPDGSRFIIPDTAGNRAFDINVLSTPGYHATLERLDLFSPGCLFDFSHTLDLHVGVDDIPE
jgi:hypothetical protein